MSNLKKSDLSGPRSRGSRTDRSRLQRKRRGSIHLIGRSFALDHVEVCLPNDPDEQPENGSVDDGGVQLADSEFPSAVSNLIVPRGGRVTPGQTLTKKGFALWLAFAILATALFLLASVWFGVLGAYAVVMLLSALLVIVDRTSIGYSVGGQIFRPTTEPRRRHRAWSWIVDLAAALLHPIANAFLILATAVLTLGVMLNVGGDDLASYTPSLLFAPLAAFILSIARGALGYLDRKIALQPTRITLEMVVAGENVSTSEIRTALSEVRQGMSPTPNTVLGFITREEELTALRLSQHYGSGVLASLARAALDLLPRSPGPDFDLESAVEELQANGRDSDARVVALASHSLAHGDGNIETRAAAALDLLGRYHIDVEDLPGS